MATAEETEKQQRLLPNSKQAVAGVGIVAALLMIQPLKDFFPTREEFTASNHRLESVEIQIRDLNQQGELRSASLRQEFKSEINQLKTDLTTMLQKNSDLFLQRNSETTSRTIEAFRSEFAARDSVIKELKDEVKELRKSPSRR